MTENSLLQEAVEGFRAAYGTEPTVIAFAPGRVNLIGEHTDYNEGLVLPMAIQQKIYTLAAPRTDGVVAARSLQVGDPVCFEASDRTRQGRWDDAVRGVIDQIEKEGAHLPGMDLLFSGDVPLEAGLSSSAAFTVSCACALAGLAGLELEPRALALLAQRVENRFMGVQCGVLDQMASAVSMAGHALLLDCRDLSFRHIALPADFRIVVCHTGVTRSLAGSGYNDRRGECALGLLNVSQRYPGLTGMRDVTLEMLEETSDRMEALLVARLRHVVTENDRVGRACEALEQGDFAALGRLLTQSHQSLRDDYEVSCVELDAMVELALEEPGCYGARLVGAGFGGCAIALVGVDRVEIFCDEMAKKYCRKMPGREGKFIPICPGNGASILSQTKA